MRSGLWGKVGEPWFEFYIEFVDNGLRKESKVFFMKGKGIETVEKN